MCYSATSLEIRNHDTFYLFFYRYLKVLENNLKTIRMFGVYMVGKDVFFELIV